MGFMEGRGMQFAYTKGLGTCDAADALLCVFHTLRSVLEKGKWRRLFDQLQCSLWQGQPSSNSSQVMHCGSNWRL